MGVVQFSIKKECVSISEYGMISRQGGGGGGGGEAYLAVINYAFSFSATHKTCASLIRYVGVAKISYLSESVA